MVERWGGSKIFGDLLEGGWKFFVFLLRGVKKFPHCLSKTFYIKCRGSKYFHFTREGGQQILFGSERGVKLLCHVILNPTTPLLLSYKWPTPKNLNFTRGLIWEGYNRGEVHLSLNLKERGNFTSIFSRKLAFCLVKYEEFEWTIRSKVELAR